jgi:hypothetical protein
MSLVRVLICRRVSFIIGALHCSCCWFIVLLVLLSILGIVGVLIGHHIYGVVRIVSVIVGSSHL